MRVALNGPVTHDGESLSCGNKDCPGRNPGYDWRGKIAELGAHWTIDLKQIRSDLDTAEEGLLWSHCHALLAEVERLGELAPRWIPVAERLPERSQRVLVHEPDSSVRLASVQGRSGGDLYFEDDECQGVEVTHWMPLPEPPE